MTSFGVLLAQNRPVAELLDWGRRFDEAAVDSLWVADHLAEPFDPNSLWFDGWTVLAAIAMSTTSCRIGPLVSNFVLQPPLRMARLTVTLDAISNGRLALALGMGGSPVCSSASSVFEPFRALADRFENGLDSLIRILDDVPLPACACPDARRAPLAGTGSTVDTVCANSSTADRRRGSGTSHDRHCREGWRSVELLSPTRRGFRRRSRRCPSTDHRALRGTLRRSRA